MKSQRRKKRLNREGRRRGFERRSRRRKKKKKKKSSQKQSKRKMTNKIFRYLPKLLADECRKIIHQNRSLGIKMQELKPEENYAHQNKDI
jgi:hypothetical protein